MEKEEFLDICKKAWEIWKENEKRYGDSWKDSDYTFLETRLFGEVKEVLQEYNVPKKARECLDVICMSVMFYERLAKCTIDDFGIIESSEKQKAMLQYAYRRFGVAGLPDGR